MTEMLPFDNVLKAMLDESKPFPPKFLHQFSDITPGDLVELIKIWPDVALSRKQSLLEDLELLAEKDTLQCFDDLARSLLKDPDPTVRTLSIRLLWECDDKKLVPAFIDTLKNDPSRTTAAAAATALGLFIYLGELEEIPSKLLKKVEDELLSAARQNKDDLVRRKALEALGASSRPEVPGLIESAYSSSDPDWIVSALFAMGRSNDQRWQKKVIACLRHKNEDIRTEAIQAAGDLSLEAARPALIRQLDDQDQGDDIWRAIVWSLSQVGGEGVRQQLEEMVELSDPEFEDFLEEALENLNITEEMASFTLLNLDSDPDLDSLLDLEDQENV
jgi:HEAT repeat protein